MPCHATPHHATPCHAMLSNKQPSQFFVAIPLCSVLLLCFRGSASRRCSKNKTHSRLLNSDGEIPKNGRKNQLKRKRTDKSQKMDGEFIFPFYYGSSHGSITSNTFFIPLWTLSPVFSSVNTNVIPSILTPRSKPTSRLNWSFLCCHTTVPLSCVLHIELLSNTSGLLGSIRWKNRDCGTGVINISNWVTSITITAALPW